LVSFYSTIISTTFISSTIFGAYTIGAFHPPAPKANLKSSETIPFAT